MFETPEQKARHEVDTDLTATGRLVQDRDDLDLAAGDQRMSMSGLVA